VRLFYMAMSITVLLLALLVVALLEIVPSLIAITPQSAGLLAMAIVLALPLLLLGALALLAVSQKRREFGLERDTPSARPDFVVRHPSGEVSIIVAKVYRRDPEEYGMATEAFARALGPLPGQASIAMAHRILTSSATEYVGRVSELVRYSSQEEDLDNPIANLAFLADPEAWVGNPQRYSQSQAKDELAGELVGP
jgi:hypothetical protein